MEAPGLVEALYGGARRLRIAAQRAGDAVGVLAPGAGEQDLATAASEEGRPSSKVPRWASESGRTKIGRLVPTIVALC